MDAPSRPTRKHPLPSGVIGMLGLVLLIEAALERDDRFKVYLGECWRMTGKAARREAVGCDVLCFGDSLVQLAVLPRAIEERSGRKVFNLGLMNGTPPASYFLLRRALDAGARPKAVVVDFMPHQLAGSPGHDLNRRRCWPEFATIGEALDFALSKRQPDVATTIWLTQALASYKARYEIAAAIGSALRGDTISIDEVLKAPAVRRNLKVNRGAYALVPSNRPGPDPDECPIDLNLVTMKYDPVMVGYVDRFLRLASAHAIPVYWLVPPISPEYQARCDAMGSDAVFTGLLRSKRAEFPNLVVVDARHSAGYAPTLFADTIHLDRRGATALTGDLDDLLAAAPPPGRWAELPAYRERPVVASVEDLVQSRRLLERAWAARVRR